MNTNYTKWVSCWGNATSITDRKEAVYARDITLRYPLYMPFDGDRLRLRLSNLTGTEPVEMTQVMVDDGQDNRQEVRFGGQPTVCILPGQEVESDEVEMAVRAGQTLRVSIYLGQYTQMNAGTLVTGPLSRGQYAYGNHIAANDMPQELTRNANWFYFLNTVDVRTREDNFALVCYGDSITAQSWPDYLTLRCQREGYNHVSIIRRAVSGTRILRQYDCLTYAAYGLKGETRFPIEMRVAGAAAVIVQHGINDIIHPVGVEVNPFRPWSDMPSLQDLTDGVEHIYLDYAEQLGLPVWLGTLLPIEGWRTYDTRRDQLRCRFNDWMRTCERAAGCIDFDAALRDPMRPQAFAEGFDSGDHLHPSERAYEAMAEAVGETLLRIED